MKRHSHIVTTTLCACLLGAAPTLVLAADFTAQLKDVHLNRAPLTPQEQIRIKTATSPTEDFDTAEKFEEKSAGAATVRARKNRDAFSQHSHGMEFEGELDFKVGNGLFKKLWVSSPASTKASDGLGPIYNARSCQRCHVKDGRGHPPEDQNDIAVSMFMRISIPSTDAGNMTDIEGYLATAPDPNYGTQVQDFGLPGVPAEAQMKIAYTEETIALSDGETASLRHPTYRLEKLGYGPLHPDAMLSPRVSPQMIGLGLLEAIPVETILAGADENDADGDGISGRPNVVWSREFNQPMLGRFGLKAGAPTVMQQSAGAFSGDIGISNPLFDTPQGECTDQQAPCLAAQHGADDIHNGYEIDQKGLDLVDFYARNLAVPARRNVNDPEVLRGKEVFYTTGCVSCHTPKFVTARLTDKKSASQSFQLIWPYTDMLLHDMGDKLADNRPEARATGQEWRTPPLWGIGLTKQVSKHSYFLHDGRARSLLEAVLWHGGEAQAARDTVVDMPKSDRDALIRFLESL
ncbi:MAG: di-heme oxidoredictase family protein [Halocynthiibacter sp.]